MVYILAGFEGWKKGGDGGIELVNPFLSHLVSPVFPLA